jgi:hypothetical protein
MAISGTIRVKSCQINPTVLSFAAQSIGEKSHGKNINIHN